jgi:hypothetical protein
MTFPTIFSIPVKKQWQDWTLDYRMTRRVVYHCATAAIASKQVVWKWDFVNALLSLRIHWQHFKVIMEFVKLGVNQILHLINCMLKKQVYKNCAMKEHLLETNAGKQLS